MDSVCDWIIRPCTSDGVRRSSSHCKITLLFVCSVLVTCQLTVAQTIGTPPLSTVVSDNPLESVNVQTLNIAVSVPIRHKAGVDGLDFALDLTQNFQLFQSGGGWWSTEVFAGPKQFAGGINDTEVHFGGGVTMLGTPGGKCPNGSSAFQLGPAQFTDSSGTPHKFSNIKIDQADCLAEVKSAYADDQSGYYAVLTHTSGSVYVGGTVYDMHGSAISIPATGNPGTTMISPNGNQLSYVNSQPSGTNLETVWTDTLGQTALTATYNTWAGTLGSTQTTTYTYTDQNGSTQTFTLLSQTMTYQTNFGCGAGTDGGPWLGLFPIQLTFPDGSNMYFSYEATNGFPQNVTGRLSSLTLPTGGQINYTYASTINCQDGTPTSMTRTFAGNPTVYKHAINTNGSSYTIVTDNSSPTKNDTRYDFNTLGIITDRISYAGPSTNNLVLDSSVTCYNGTSTQNGNSVTCGQPVKPFFRRDDWHIVPNLTGPSEVTTLYATTGGAPLIPVEVKAYNYGSPTPVLVSDTTTEYGTYVSGSDSCSTQGLPTNLQAICRSTQKDSSGNKLALERVTYDAKGNVLTDARWVGGATYLTNQATYNSNGTKATATDVNGTTVATYTNTSCNNLFPTTQSFNVVSWSTTTGWDCNGGVKTSQKDGNGQTTTYDYLDPLWRLVSITDPTNAALFNYYNFFDGSSNAYIDSSICISSCSPDIADNLTYSDAYGRVSEVQHLKAALSADYDTIVYTYDSNGRLYSTSIPCVSTNGPGATCSSAVTTQTYDALGRPLVKTDGGGGTLANTYTGRDVLVVTSSPNTSKQYEYDGLGRLISVCEVSSTLPGVGTCKQDTSRTGYWTRYQYDALGRLTGVCQNTSQPYSVNCVASPSSGQQTRTFAYDGLSRLISDSNPENGQKQYFYDSAPSSPGVACPGAFNGELVKVYDSNGNTTCFAYDGLHRVVSTTYSGPNSNGVNRYFVYDAATVNGAAMQNTKARLAEAYTATSQNGTKLTDEGFSYSPRGDLTDVYESTPHSGGYYHTSVSYFENGVIKTLSGIPGQTGFTFGVDSEGRLATAKQGSTNLVSSTTFNAASQPLVITLGQGDTDTYQYDPNTGRMTNYTFTVGATPKSMIGALTWNTDGSLRKLAITDGFNSGGTQTCKYGDPTNNIPGYDDLRRLIKVDCGASTWQQNFSYDAFGNLTKAVPTGGTGIAWNPGYNAATNHYTLGGTTYDANGDLLMDTFHTYTWNADAHPLTIDSSTCGANGICLTYDALGRMVEKNISGSYSEVLYGPTGKLAIMNGQALVNSYIPLPGGATFNLAAGYARLWHKDWLGTVRLSTTLSNRTVDYDRALAPFGETYSNFGSSTNYNFAGDTQDTISGTYDTVNRELNPSQGRWLTPDPAGLGSLGLLNPQTFNRYAYVLDSPLIWVDPTGLDIDADGCIWNQTDTTNTLNCPVPDVNQIPSDAANNENTLNVQAANLSEIALRQRAATTAKNCSVTVDCDNSWTSHCGLTVGQNGKYTDYNGEPSTTKLGPLLNPFSNVTLMVQVNGPTAPPGGPGTGNIIFQSPVSCSVANCIQKSADYTNAAGLPYSAPGIRGENSNWWASTTTRVCGLSVNYPWNAIGTVP